MDDFDKGLLVGVAQGAWVTLIIIAEIWWIISLLS